MNQDQPPRQDSDAYLKKKQFFGKLLTVYGRKPVLEALQDKHTQAHRLHLAESNKSAAIIDDIIELATKKGAEILYHDKQALSRISKNSKQDQGVAVDLVCKDNEYYKDFLTTNGDSNIDIIALDRITNPQNLGMIIRSVCAGGSRALLLPEKGCAKLDALVIKASAGTLFRTPILRCQDIETALRDFRAHQYDVYGLSSHAKDTLKQVDKQGRSVFVLGNETDGVSKSVENICNKMVAIPMSNGVESLNVAVTASLLAYRKLI